MLRTARSRALHCSTSVTPTAYMRDCDTHNPGTSVSPGQTSFFSSCDIWGTMRKPILCYLGNPPIIGASSKATEGYNVTQKNTKTMQGNATALDTARATNLHRSLMQKKAIKSVLPEIDPSLFPILLKFEEIGCPYSSLKVTPDSNKFEETMAIIFSGSHNHGNQVFSDRLMPFVIEEHDGIFSASLKINWKSYFPSALNMYNSNIEKSTLEMIFSKRKSTAPPISHGLITPIELASGQDLSSNYLMRDDFDITSNFLDHYYPNPLPLKPIVNELIGPKGEYDESYGANRGEAKILSSRGVTEEIDFNVDMTVSVGRKFGGEHGTHKWKLGCNFIKNNAVLFEK